MGVWPGDGCQHVSLLQAGKSKCLAIELGCLNRNFLGRGKFLAD